MTTKQNQYDTFQDKNASEQMRVVRGYAIISKGDTPKQIDQTTFEVPSQSGNGTYLISRKGKFSCSCPDFVGRQMDCKHIHAVKFFLGFREKVRRDNLPFTEKTIPNCPYCKATDVIRRGKRYGKRAIKQIYSCNICKRKFIEEKDFEKMKGDSKITTLILDLYFKGISLRKISDHLKQFHDLDLDASNILRRIMKYNKVIDDYVRTLTPELGNQWHTDEMKIQAGGKWRWLWNVMDRETKFLITRRVTDRRRIKDSAKVLTQAKNIAQKQPAFIITDGCVSYAESVKEALGSTQHVRLTSIRDKRINNNIMERLNGTIRDRIKTMRGMDSLESSEAMTNAFQNYYNFIQVHSVLGKTPAEQAGIGIGGRNRWKALLEKSLE